jgi:hypothetical protein
MEDTYLPLAVGAVLGFASAIGSEWVRRRWEKNARKDHGKKLLEAVLDEVRQGMERCDYLIRMKKNGNVSFSRVYTALWDSSRLDLSQTIEDLEILRLLHSLHYRFDLINFNMNRGEFGVGAAHTEDHSASMQDYLKKLEVKVSSLD